MKCCTEFILWTDEFQSPSLNIAGQFLKVGEGVRSSNLTGVWNLEHSVNRNSRNLLELVVCQAWVFNTVSNGMGQSDVPHLALSWPLPLMTLLDILP